MITYKTDPFEFCRMPSANIRIDFKNKTLIEYHRKKTGNTTTKPYVKYWII